MRDFSAAVSSIINTGDNIRFIYLIELDFGTTYRFTSHHSDVEYPIGSGLTYLSDGGIFEFDAPNYSTVIDREAYRIVISDQIDNMLTEMKNGVIGRAITVKLALLGGDNQPLLDEADIIDVYRGYVDKPKFSNDFDQKLVTFEGTSPMSDLDATNNYLTSKDGVSRKVASALVVDSSYDEIYPNSEVMIKWGKK